MKIYITTTNKYLDGINMYTCITGAYKEKNKAKEVTQQKIKAQIFLWEGAKLEELKEEDFYCAKINFRNKIKQFMINEIELE